MNRALVVGAGLSGLTVARRLHDSGWDVQVTERREHIGGNAWSEVDPATGIEVHRYGAHIFHTANQRAWAWAKRFGSFTSYRHHVWAEHQGRAYPLPFSLATLSLLLGRRLTPQDALDFLASDREGDVAAARNLEEKALALIGRTMYEAFVKDYTQKQWQTDPTDLPASVISRLPFRLTYDTRYFSDPFEGMPTEGYAAWLTQMAEGLRVETSSPTTPGQVRAALERGTTVIWTGPLDALFDHRHGALGWRTVDFDLRTVPLSSGLGTAVMNFSDADVPYTRAVEFRHFHPEREASHSPDRTVVAWETSRWAEGGDEPYYPVNRDDDRRALASYRTEAAALGPQFHLLGRLGTYAYLDMHMAIASGLVLADRILGA